MVGLLYVAMVLSLIVASALILRRKGALGPGFRSGSNLGARRSPGPDPPIR